VGVEPGLGDLEHPTGDLDRQSLGA
jgi:hypothetical protein